MTRWCLKQESGWQLLGNKQAGHKFINLKIWGENQHTFLSKICLSEDEAVITGTGLGLFHALCYFFTRICHILTSSCNYGWQVPKTIPSHLLPKVCLHLPACFPNSLYILRRDMQIKRLWTSNFFGKTLVIRNR